MNHRDEIDNGSDPLQAELKSLRLRALSVRSYDQLGEQIRQRPGRRLLPSRSGRRIAALLAAACAAVVIYWLWHPKSFVGDPHIAPAPAPLVAHSIPDNVQDEEQFTLGTYIRACDESTETLMNLLDRQAARPPATPVNSVAFSSKEPL